MMKMLNFGTEMCDDCQGMLSICNEPCCRVVCTHLDEDVYDFINHV